jgi:hypothetical protein
MDNKQLDQLINTAMKKVGAKKDNDICHYIPVPTGGYMHHFTLRKMKGEDPAQLESLLTTYIINPAKPNKVTPKTRAPRGTRKRRDALSFSKQELERMVQMARIAGDDEMVRKLSRNTKDIKTIKRELISSIRHNRCEPELWNLYADSISSPTAAPAFAHSQA